MLILSILFVMFLFIIDTETYMQSIKRGLTLYVGAVLPSMLPFFFFSKLLTELDFANDAGKLLKKPLEKIYHTPPCAGYILLMSMLCGYPVGAKLIGEFYENGFLDEKQASKISSFTSTAGPIFVIGTIGVTMFGNKSYGFILLISHYLGALANGFIYRGKKSDCNQISLPQKSLSNDILNKSMANTFLSVGIVGGYITIFNLIFDMFGNIGIIPAIAKVGEFLGVNSKLTSGWAGGLIEMTIGCQTLANSGFDIRITLPICAFLIAFGGLSVTFQSITFLSKTKISPAHYILCKFSQGILSTIFCIILCLLFVR